MRLGTKLTLTTSIVVGIVVGLHGYQTIATRRNILLSRMKREVRAIARTARIYVEKGPYREGRDTQSLVNGIGQFEKTLGVFVELHGDALQSDSLKALPRSFERNLELSRQVIRRGEVLERFSRYGKIPVFVYFEPLRGSEGQVIGSMGIIQHTAFLEEDIWATKLAVIMTIVVLIGLIAASILFLIRFNVTRPISHLIEKIRRVGRGQFDAEVLIDRKDELGELAWEFNQMAANLREVEKRVLAEEDKKAELEQRMRHLERLATIGQLASGLAHEIGTPLNVVSGRAGYLKERITNREIMEKNLDIIVRQSQRITNIIKQLLSFSRKESSHFVRTELAPAIETAFELLGYLIRKQGIKVVKTVPPDLPRVNGDPEQLQQVFLNLIHNAVQAMPDGGELVLEVRGFTGTERKEEDRRTSSVEIQIRDTGRGMKPEVLGNIFKPFFTTKANGKGTGLGLPIAYGIVRDHGGSIDVNTKEGKGTTVRVSLPGSVPHEV